MTNFQNITNEMISDKACVQVSNTEELKNQILFFLDEKNINISKEYINNARKYVENREKIFINYLKQICRFFND